MSRRLRLFLSSPGDVADERRQCVEAVEEINTTMRAFVPERDLDLEVIRWEHDTHPNLTGSPQAEVDSQLDVDYDVFLGIMWSRYHASLALLAAARGLAPDHLDEIRVALDQAQAFAERLGPDSDRDTILTHARRELARRTETAARG